MRRFTHTFPQRISAFLLCLALLVGLLPTSALAAGTDTGKAIQLGTSGIGDPTSTKNSKGTYYTPSDYVYFGVNGSTPIKWRVLDADKTNDGTTSGMFLLSEYLLDSDVVFESAWNSDDNDGQTNPNEWQHSDAQNWCSTFAIKTDVFSTAEQEAFLGVAKTDSAESSLYSMRWGASSLTENDKVFFLSVRELADYVGSYDGAPGLNATDTAQSADAWWLRSPSADGTDNVGAVCYDGYVRLYIVYNEWAARPAINLNLNSVLFTSAAEGGKSSAAESGDTQGGEAADAIFEIGDYAGNEWKLTLLDSNRNFSVTEETASGKPGDTITLNYTGATVYNAATAPNEYISVIIADDSGAQYYGRITQPTSADGQVEITIPTSLADGTYTLNVFSEQYNGGENDDTKLTDYASTFAKVVLTVVDGTAPTLSGGSATRDSETSATVKFTSNEAGSYYYAVVESGAAEPSIDTTGTGTACVSGENTISLTSLSDAGAKDIYIVAKDAAGNVSEKLKITIPAIYTLTVNLNGGSGSTTGGEYPAGEVVNIDAGSRSNYRFNGWTSSTGGSFADASSASTTFTMPAGNVTITANWQYDPPYIPPTKPDGPSTGTSDGWTDIQDEIADAEDGDTITIDMNGETEVPGDIWEAIAGKDVTVILDMGEDISWTVDGSDVPTATSFSSMDFGVDMNTSGISVDVINTVTGEVSSVQITLAHDGEFGFALTLSAPLGKENAGYWANLYHYDENAKTLNYETSAQVASDGTASLRMTHASQYAIVIDDKSHDLPFTDLGEGQWYESAVRYAYTHDIMEGMSATKFSPNISLTRAQAVQVLYNLEGQPTVSGNAAFPDQVEEWYKPAIAWAEQTGVVDGYEDGTFRPGQPVTRQEFAQMLYNYAAYKGYDLTAQGDLTAFPDGDSVQPWAETAMTWANGNQLINGHDDGTLEPGGTTTRAQAASILMRFDQNVVEN